ncbi:MAG: glycosyltransferase family 2 protein [Bacteroidaceae bacterium]|nr:glycosyltransferase family 2 protein [Prevotellaceae bacterium]MDY5632688.1 glycosyltransferase family 2 protein [Bacteroidaceae bacterium]
MTMFSKIFRALWGLPSSFSTPLAPRIVMTLLVKDEEDILEQNLLFHHSMGVDAFIVTDNNSSDGTLGIIDKYEKKGWIVEVIRETACDYSQKKWVDRMVMLAIRKYAADWVINADADEFWYPPQGSFPKYLSGVNANVLHCSVVNVYPEPGLFWQEWSQTVREVVDAERFGLSPYSLFSHHKGKVMHRANGYIQISMGNHKVLMLWRRQQHSDIIVYHYPVRGKEHFLRKMINGGKQLEQNLRKRGGRHWRYCYELHKQGKLEEEYERMVGSKCRAQLIQGGFIVPDQRMKNLLAHLV